MSDLIRKPLTVALAAVLVFSACVPVPSGVGAYDRLRFGQANANPAVAVPVIVATALAAAGVYVAGYEASQYSSNQSAVSDAFINHLVSAGLYGGSTAAAAALSSAVDAAGNIDIGALAEMGIMGEVSDFSSYMLQQGLAVSGTTSGYANVTNVSYGALVFTCAEPPADALARFANKTIPSGQTLKAWGYNYKGEICFYWCKEEVWFKSSDHLTIQSGNTWGRINSDNTLDWNPNSRATNYIYPSSHYLVPGANITVDSNVEVTTNTTAGYEAVIDQNVVNTAQDFSGLVVQPLEPTAEQLQAGYDYTAIAEAINGQTGVISADLSGIAAGISGLSALLSPLAGIAANVQNIRDWWSSFATSTTTPLPWYQSLWNSLLGVLGNTPIATLLSPISSGIAAIQTWLGDTPFGDVMGDLLDGVLGIPDAVVQGAADVCGVLDGVLDASLGLAGDIADALGLDALVDSILSPLVGVYEAVTGKDGTPSFFTDNVTLGLPNGFDDGLRLRLEDKVPFCYVIRSYTAIGQMFGNFSGNRSFYLDLDIPNAGNVRMDGEIVLSQRMGTLDIATTIRILATSLLCLGLLYRAYKVVERGTGGF